MLEEPALLSQTPKQLVTPAVNQPYWQIATSINTRKAYQSDIRHFIGAGGVLPASIEMLLHYLN